MPPRPVEVKPLDNFTLQILFNNGEKRLYDMKKQLDKPFYQKLKSPAIFKTVKVADITLEWATGEDICPNEIYKNSTPVLPA
jgi:hypothetical protein